MVARYRNQRGTPVDEGRRALCLLALAALSAAAFGAAPARADSAEFVVIVHPSHASNVAPRELVAAAFLKRTTRWSDGETIRPVDQRPSSHLRKSFSSQIVKRSVGAVRNYWQQRIFSGRGVPPPELDSDEVVIEYVSRYPGAIGYVSPTAKLGGVKVLTISK